MQILHRTYYPTFAALAIACLCSRGAYAQEDFPYYAYNLVENKSELKPGENIEEKIRQNFFLLTEVNKKECYVGEPLMAVFKAYSRLDASSQVVKRPSLSGFSVMEMVDAYSDQPHVEKYKGDYFFVHLIRKVQLFPLQEGEQVLEPAEVESTIYFTAPGKTSSHLRGLFRRPGNDADTSLLRHVLFHTPAVPVKVKPLPLKAQPADFSGAVGKFTVALRMKETSIRQDEPATVKLLIKGSGNIPLITDPAISWPRGLRVAGPLVTDDVNRYAYPLSGVKTFEYTLQAPDTGRYEIPPVRFSYFDPSSEEYKEVETASLSYSVLPADTASAQGPAEPFASQGAGPLPYYILGVIALAAGGWLAYRLLHRPRSRNDSA